MTSYSLNGENIIYTYDNVGNRLTETGVQEKTAINRQFAYDKANQLVSIKEGSQETKFTFDKKGNMVEDGNNIYSYNSLNQLTKLQGKGINSDFKITTGNDTKNLYWLDNKIAFESDENKSQIARNINNPIDRVARVNEKSQESPGAISFYQYDAHKDVRTLTDLNGSTQEQYSYDPWGKPIFSNDTVHTNPYLYGGEYYDDQTGLYNLKARDYNPEFGRFVTKDTYRGDLTDPRSFNLYSYVYNNPAKYADPSGHFPVHIVVAAAFALMSALETYAAFSDPCSTSFDKGIAMAGFLPGVGPIKKAGQAVKAGTKLAGKTDDLFEGFQYLSKGTGEYSKVGGHHVHAKSAFKDNVNYDPKKGFSISQSFMKDNGLNHQHKTNKQRELFKELNESGRPNSLQEHTRIAVEALIAGGATRQEARDLVAASHKNLRQQGVREPSNIP
ncbi:RHS repeat domain-containing protein [Bacillus sp. SJS]|uniref:RHS repeat domain-containing protein n=1 Tax=Bacillus sp. SJS TaxID=1423321 RepID=UPI0012E776CB|nr:RHS repeat-associated core domain-containing protein [Bacillus sp. SJS]